MALVQTLLPHMPACQERKNAISNKTFRDWLAHLVWDLQLSLSCKHSKMTRWQKGELYPDLRTYRLYSSKEVCAGTKDDRPLGRPWSYKCVLDKIQRRWGFEVMGSRISSRDLRSYIHIPNRPACSTAFDQCFHVLHGWISQRSLNLPDTLHNHRARKRI